MSQVNLSNRRNISKLNIAHVNVRSVVPNINDIKAYIVNNNIDILAVSESWLCPAIADEAINVNNFGLVRKDRTTGRGGGVLLFVKNTIQFLEINDCKTEYSEQIWVSFKTKNTKTILGLIYRPPGRDSVRDFLSEFEENVCKNLLNCDNFVCVGDFNINFLDLNCIYTQRFHLLLNAYNLVQLINEPTRRGACSATLIDMILCSDADMVEDSEVDHAFHVSDHFLIKCKMKLEIFKPKPFLKTCRDYRHFDQAAFCRDLQNVPFNDVFYLPTVDQKVSTFNYYITELFNLHAPQKTFRITKKPAPWLTENIKLCMSLRDKALSKYRKRGTAENWESYRQLRNFVSSAIVREKRAYLENGIRNNGPRDNWRLLKNINVYSQTKKVVPEHLGTPDEINNFFANVAQCGHPDLDTLNFYLNNTKNNVAEFKFRLATIEEVEEAISSIKSAAVGCDGIGLSMLRRCCPHVLPVIIHIINFCIETSTFPECWKTSYVLPFPKVSSPSELKQLRPISILPTLSKVIEKVLEAQVREHATRCQILPALQSGYRKDYSCTTALLKVTDDILEASDRGELTALVLLDYSKAFDRLNHSLLLAILHYIGFEESAARLVHSYLADRNQAVRVNGKISGIVGLSCGVPQGSILGPLLFLIYTSQLRSYLRFSAVHFYADDTQLYLSFSPNNIEEANYRLTHDLNVLKRASEAHCLSINPSKSQLLLFGRKQCCDRYRNLLNISINNELLTVCNSAKNLGITINSNLRFTEHINNCIKRAFTNLKLIYSQRSLLNESLKKMLCDSIVLSHFNYGDVLYGPCLLDMDVKRIQLMQNSCVRLIGGIRGRDRGVSAKLREIKWLNMLERRLFHSLVLFNSIINKKRPDYLYDKIKFRFDVHNLDLRHKYDITPPKHTTALYERCFSYQVAYLYNKVPIEYKSISGPRFKFYLKGDIQSFL